MNPRSHTSSGLNAAAVAGPGISQARRWSLVGLLALAALINYLDRATLSVALPQISTDLSLGPTAKGVVLSAFFWSYALMQVPVGMLADRWNLRWLYAGAFALWSVACGLTGAAGGLATLILARIVLGVGESVYLPGGLKLVSTLFPSRDRGLPTGFFDSGTRLGLALGAPLVAWLTVRYGWRTMFFLVGFLALVWLLPWLLAFPSPFPHSAVDSPAQERTLQRPGLWRLSFDRNLLGCCLGFFCFGYYQYLLVTWLPDYFVRVRHFSLLAGRRLRFAYLLGVGPERAPGRLDLRPAHPPGMGRDASAERRPHRRFLHRTVADSSGAGGPCVVRHPPGNGSFPGGAIYREYFGDLPMLRTARASGGMDRNGEFHWQPRRRSLPARNGDSD